MNLSFDINTQEGDKVVVSLFFFISLILRSQEPLVELLRKEVQNNFETITGQK